MHNADLRLHKKALQRLGFVRGKFLQGTSNVLKMYAANVLKMYSVCIKNVLNLYLLFSCSSMHVQNLIDLNEGVLRG